MGSHFDARAYLDQKGVEVNQPPTRRFRSLSKLRFFPWDLGPFAATFFRSIGWRPWSLGEAGGGFNGGVFSEFLGTILLAEIPLWKHRAPGRVTEGSRYGWYDQLKLQNFSEVYSEGACWDEDVFQFQALIFDIHHENFSLPCPVVVNNPSIIRLFCVWGVALGGAPLNFHESNVAQVFKEYS